MAGAKSTRNINVPGYSSWQKMIYRCYNPRCAAYADYGGRGIAVCDEWRSFSGFHKDMGDRPEGKSLDRINGELGYFKGNCRWATRKEQNNNRRTVRRITYDGKTLTMSGWAAVLGIDKRVLSLRLTRLGWSDERTVSTPKRAMSPRG